MDKMPADVFALAESIAGECPIGSIMSEPIATALIPYVQPRVRVSDMFKLQWCGIFVTYCLNNQIGSPELGPWAVWRLNAGIRLTRSATHIEHPLPTEPLEAGDVLISADPPYHYRYVFHVYGDDAYLLEANTPAVRAICQSRTMPKRHHRDRYRVG